MAVSTEFDDKKGNYRTTGFDNGNHQYSSSGLPSIVFLSKRGISRSPLAKEILSRQIYHSDYCNSIHCFARGISDVYDLLSFDKRMVYRASLKGYILSGQCRTVNLLEISSAKFIIPLDQESQQYIKYRTYYINGKVIPIGEFLNSTSHRYIPDPFESGSSKDFSQLYDDIIKITKDACYEIISSLPNMIN